MTDPTSPPTQSLDASVVLPVRDGATTIARQLSALSCQTFAGTWEVVVADNASTDGTAEVVERWRGRLPEMRVVAAGERRGINVARNAGIAAARGRVVALCDDDDEVTPGWLAALVDALGLGADIAGGPAHEGEPPSTPGGLPVADGFLPYAVGANMALRREAWECLGGFDEDYRYGADDIELSWRAQLAGCRIAYAPGAVVLRPVRVGLAAWAQGFAYGVGGARLRRDFAYAGVSRAGPAAGGWRGAWRMAQIGHLARPRSRREWVRHASFAAGRLVGSVRFRVLHL